MGRWLESGGFMHENWKMNVIKWRKIRKLKLKKGNLNNYRHTQTHAPFMEVGRLKPCQPGFYQPQKLMQAKGVK